MGYVLHVRRVTTFDLRRVYEVWLRAWGSSNERL